MKGCIILLDLVADRRAAARLIDGRLDDLIVDPGAAGPPPPGAIYRAICDRPVKGQGGMFVRLCSGVSGFLRQAKGVSAGQTLLVQVSGYAEPGKAVPVTDRVLFKSRYCIVTPDAPGTNVARGIRDTSERARLLALAERTIPDPGNVGIIMRSASSEAEPEDIVGDLDATWHLARRIMTDRDGSVGLFLDGPDAHMMAWRDWTDPRPDEVVDETGAFDRFGVREMITDLRRDSVAIGNGATMMIEPTRALVAIDVNTGADGSPAAGLKANIAAVRELPRQLRCRGLGGQITIDFAPAPKKDRRHIETTLNSVFRADPVATTLVGWTPLGHFELQRQRSRLPLIETLS